MDEIRLRDFSLDFFNSYEMRIIVCALENYRGQAEDERSLDATMRKAEAANRMLQTREWLLAAEAELHKVKVDSYL